MAGTITLFATNTIPSDFLECDGSTPLIASYPALAAVLGTSFGGDGITTFGLPDLRGRTPIGVGTGAGLTPRALADTGGVETVQLVEAELPSHNHSLNATNDIANSSSTDEFYTARGVPELYTTDTTNANLNANALATVGSDTPHQNMQPFLALKYAIYNGLDTLASYIGQIGLYPSNTIPIGFLECDGSTPLIASYPALAAVLGTAFGGDGITTFGLPDMRGRTPIGVGAGGSLTPRVLADTGGAETHLLSDNETSHRHLLLASFDAATTADPTGAYFATANFLAYFDGVLTLPSALRDTMSIAGSDTPHQNMQPFLALKFMIKAE